jgi:hypothetical protein
MNEITSRLTWLDAVLSSQCLWIPLSGVMPAGAGIQSPSCRARTAGERHQGVYRDRSNVSSPANSLINSCSIARAKTFGSAKHSKSSRMRRVSLFEFAKNVEMLDENVDRTSPIFFRPLGISSLQTRKALKPYAQSSLLPKTRCAFARLERKMAGLVYLFQPFQARDRWHKPCHLKMAARKLSGCPCVIFREGWNPVRRSVLALSRASMITGSPLSRG